MSRTSLIPSRCAVGRVTIVLSAPTTVKLRRKHLFPKKFLEDEMSRLAGIDLEKEMANLLADL